MLWTLTNDLSKLVGNCLWCAAIDFNALIAIDKGVITLVTSLVTYLVSAFLLAACQKVSKALNIHGLGDLQVRLDRIFCNPH